MIDQTPPLEYSDECIQTDAIDDDAEVSQQSLRATGVEHQQKVTDRPVYVPFKTGVDSSTQVIKD